MNSPYFGDPSEVFNSVFCLLPDQNLTGSKKCRQIILGGFVLNTPFHTLYTQSIMALSALVARMKKELQMLQDDPPHGIAAWPVEERTNLLRASKNFDSTRVIL
jgi:hypothetical protein